MPRLLLAVFLLVYFVGSALGNNNGYVIFPLKISFISMPFDESRRHDRLLLGFILAFFSGLKWMERYLRFLWDKKNNDEMEELTK